MQRDQLYNFHPKISEAEVKEFEKWIGCKLPDHYRSFVLTYHAASLQESMRHCPVKGAKKGDEILFLIPIAPTQETGQGVSRLIGKQEELEDYELEVDISALTPLLFIGEGGTQGLYLSLSRGNFGKLILFHPNYSREMEVIGDNLDHFLDTLGPCTINLEECPTNLPPWSLIAKNKYEEIFRMIEQGFPVDSIAEDDLSGKTMLMLALQGCRIKLVEGLLARGANPNARSSNGQPAIFYSALFNEGLKLMVDAGADLEAIDSQGNTLLLYCIKRFTTWRWTDTHVGLTKRLVDLGANVMAETPDGLKAIDIVQKHLNAFEKEANKFIHRINPELLAKKEVLEQAMRSRISWPTGRH